MFRTSDIVLIAVMVSAAAMTYAIKRDAEEERAAVRRLQAQIHTEEDTINLLKADWSLLTQPARLQALVERYQAQLGLEPVDSHQIVQIQELPMKTLTIEDLTGGQMVENDKHDRDQVVTGAVR
ncbi:cell division protein FtsL [Mesorhizobium sp. PUT5]|uniref:cell division protein FtsL n=1 Tax=Mesorhizobium sp. PUT5 TaxID=3454629 RepID=UPI003FA443CF